MVHTPADDILHAFDKCTKTSLVLCDNSTQVMVSYDDAQLMRLKGEFVKEGSSEFAMFENRGEGLH